MSCFSIFFKLCGAGLTGTCAVQVIPLLSQGAHFGKNVFVKCVDTTKEEIKDLKKIMQLVLNKKHGITNFTLDDVSFRTTVLVTSIDELEGAEIDVVKTISILRGNRTIFEKEIFSDEAKKKYGHSYRVKFFSDPENKENLAINLSLEQIKKLIYTRAYDEFVSYSTEIETYLDKSTKSDNQ